MVVKPEWITRYHGIIILARRKLKLFYDSKRGKMEMKDIMIM